MNSSNFTGKQIKLTPYSFELNQRVGREVLIHIKDNGNVIIFAPNTKTEGTLDIVYNSVDEAKEFFTCTGTTDINVFAEFNHMLSRRYR